jgi:hypothetical protein
MAQDFPVELTPRSYFDQEVRHRAMLPPASSNVGDRIKYGATGLAVGLFFGIFIGWSLHGLIGIFFRLMISLVVLIPLALALVFWLKVNQQNEQERSTIRDAEWRDINDAP